MKKILFAVLILMISSYANATLLWEQNKGQLIYQNALYSGSEIINYDPGFNVNFYGDSFSDVWVNSNGTISFNDGNHYEINGNLPRTQDVVSAGVPIPNRSFKMLAPLWDYLIANNVLENGDPDSDAGVWANVLGSPGSRKLVVTWNHVAHFNEMSNPSPYYGSSTFQVTLFENCDNVVFSYLNLDGLKDPAHTGGYSFGDLFFPNNSNGVTIGVNAGDFNGDPYIRGNEYLYGFPNISLLPEDDSILLTYNENFYAAGVGEYTFSTYNGECSNPVPEPSTLVLTGTALLGFLFVRRRRSH